MLTRVFLLFIICSCLIQAQSSFYYTNDVYAKYIEYSINNGSLNLKYPCIKPYSMADIGSKKADFNNGLKIGEYLENEILSYNFDPEKSPSGIVKGDVKLNFTQSVIAKSRNSVRLSINYPANNFAFKSSFQFDQNFKDDSTYFGELGEWYYGRFDEAYLVYRDDSGKFNASFGRVNRNLGSYSSNSLVLSDNPYSFDHLWLQYKNDLFSFSFLSAKLEDKYGFDVRSKDSLSYGWYKRFYSLHRLDINVFDNLKVALTEVVIYGGKNQQWLSYYQNPFIPFYISKNNERSSTDEGEANIYLALDIWYKPVKSVTLFTQIFIDDIDFKSENREKFPERKAIFGSLTLTDLVLPLSQLGVAATWVENWTYNSFYTWANYNFHERSIGYPFNSFQKFELFFDYFGIQPMIISGKVSYSEKGDNSLNNPFGATFELFPMGVVEKTINLEAKGSYFFSSVFIGDILLTYSKIQNEQHIKGMDGNQYRIEMNLKYQIY